MKKICLLLVFVMVLGTAFTASAVKADDYGVIEKLTGAHYNLNIIGVNPKTAEMKDTSGHVIFVNLNEPSKIWLDEGETFEVVDKNGTDNDGAKFKLPNPDENDDGTTEYSVFVRALGKPNKWAEMTPGFTSDGAFYASAGSVIVNSNNKRDRFRNVSKELLFIYFDFDGKGKAERCNLFDERFEEVFWNYGNNGLKLLQLRFYKGYETTAPAEWPEE